MTDRPDTSQSLQRVKVGLIGLAVVVLLIMLASAVLGSATRSRTNADVPASNLVTEIAGGNANAPAGEPLAEIGVAPSTANAQDPAGTR